MLEIKTNIRLGSSINYIGFPSGIFPDKSYINENMMPVFGYDDRGKTIFGYINNHGTNSVKLKYYSITAFNDGVAWVTNENDVPILIDKKGKELTCLKNINEYLLAHDYTILEKEKKEYLKNHKSFAKKNKFNHDAKYKLFKTKNMFGLKKIDGTTILPAEYRAMYIDGDILIVDNMVYDLSNFKPTYEVEISYDGLSLIETFDNYSDSKNFISKFRKEFQNNLILVHEEFEKNLKSIQEKKNRDITKSFYDADKKVQSNFSKTKKGKK